MKKILLIIMLLSLPINSFALSKRTNKMIGIFLFVSGAYCIYEGLQTNTTTNIDTNVDIEKDSTTDTGTTYNWGGGSTRYERINNMEVIKYTTTVTHNKTNKKSFIIAGSALLFSSGCIYFTPNKIVIYKKF